MNRDFVRVRLPIILVVVAVAVISVLATKRMVSRTGTETKVPVVGVMPIGSVDANAQPAIPSGLVETPGRTQVDPDEWAVYRNKKYGYEIKYPAAWQVLEAKPRVGSGSGWAPEILDQDELQKVNFLEREYEMWQGQFQVVVLAKPEKQTFAEWVEAYDCTDVNGDTLITSVADDRLDGRPAKIYYTFEFDCTGIGIAAEHRGHILMLGYAGSNPNDPAQEKHEAIYEFMKASLRWTD